MASVSATHDFTTVENWASLPPTVTVTRFVVELSADSWSLRTSAMVAPLHVTSFNVYSGFVAAHSLG